MARKQKSREPTPSRTRSARAGAALNVLATVFSCVLLLGIVVGLIVGREALLRRAAELRARPVKLQFDWPPLAIPPGGILHEAIDGVPNTWLDVASRRKLEELVLSRVQADPFDNGPVRAAQEALVATGWFDDRCRVERQADGVVHVHGTWRIPVAAVRSGDRDFVVASRGERLDADYPPDGSGLRTIIGPRMPPPRLGEPWLGGDVQAGLTLLAFLRDMPFAHQVAAIDVSEYAAHKRLLIITDRGSVIVWGGEPGQFHAGQARDDQKRSILLRLFRESGRIDKGRDVVNVSLSSGY